MENLLKSIINANITSDDTFYDLYMDVREFVMGLTYLKHRESKERIRTYIECDCEYDYTIETLRNSDIDTTIGALKTSVWYANKKLKELLGSDILYNIQNNPDIVRYRLQMIHTPLDSVVSSEVLKRVNNTVQIPYDLKDCKNELLYLARFSKVSFEFYTRVIDKNKLGYLLRLMQQPNPDEVELSLNILGWLKNNKRANKQDLDILMQAIDNL